MSWQSELACWLLRRQVRPKTLSPVIDVQGTRALAERRRPFQTRVPAGWQLRECYGAADAPRGEWLEPVNERAAPTLLYFHGGGYYFCSPATHRPLVFALTAKAGARSFSVDYRLAPEAPFPAAHEDALAAYAALLEAGVDPATIVLGGDSAGGGLALALLVALRDRGAPLPAGAVLFSPGPTWPPPARRCAATTAPTRCSPAPRWVAPRACTSATRARPIPMYRRSMPIRRACRRC